MTEPRSWSIKLPWPKPTMSLNDRKHWRVKARETAEIREMTGWLVRSKRLPPLELIRVELEWWVPDQRTRDEDNPAPALKAIYDGIVDAGVVPDDKPRFMEKKGCKIIYEKGRSELILQITEVVSHDQ